MTEAAYSHSSFADVQAICVPVLCRIPEQHHASSWQADVADAGDPQYIRGMRSDSAATDVPKDTGFQYIGGDRSTDFVNTASSAAHGPDRLASYGALLEWARGSGVLSRAAAAALQRRSVEYPARAVRVLAEATQLRLLLEQLFSKLVQNEIADTEIAELNTNWLPRSFGELALIQTDNHTLELAWPRAEAALEAPLWVIAHTAAVLLSSSDMSHIKRCGGNGCGWYFVDRSRNGLRRWCEMETCGTHMKSVRRASRNQVHRLTV